MKVAIHIIWRNFLRLIVSLLFAYIVLRLYNHVNNLKFSVAFIGGAMGGIIVDSIKILPEER